MFLRSSSTDFLLETQCIFPWKNILRFPGYVKNLLYQCSLIGNIRNTLEIRPKFTKCYRGAHRIQETWSFSPGNYESQGALGSRLLTDSWATRLSWKLESRIIWYKDRKPWLALESFCSCLLETRQCLFGSWEFWSFEDFWSSHSSCATD